MIVRVLPLASSVLSISFTLCPLTWSLSRLLWGKDSTLPLGGSRFLIYSSSWLYVTTLTITLSSLPSRILMRSLAHFCHLYGYRLKPVFNLCELFDEVCFSGDIHVYSIYLPEIELLGVF